MVETDYTETSMDYIGMPGPGCYFETISEYPPDFKFAKSFNSSNSSLSTPTSYLSRPSELKSERWLQGQDH